MKIAYAAVAQSVERRIGSAEVTGPIPVSSSSKGVEVLISKDFHFFVNEKKSVAFSKFPPYYQIQFGKIAYCVK